MHQGSRIYVAGHRGMVGSAIRRELERRGFRSLIGPARAALDLLDAAAVQEFYAQAKPEFVFFAAAKVGGILANDTLAAEFIYQNLQIQNNVIHQAWKAGVKKLLFLGSSCIYPKLAPRRSENVPGLPPAIWLPVHQRHAHEPVRTERQL